MNILSSNFTKIFTLKTIFIDFLILIGIYIIPTISHISPFPLYYLDPMRVFMLLGFIFSRNKLNAYLLAATIPLFSSFVVGHPPIFKAALISIELTVNILFFMQFLKRSNFHVAKSIFLSIIASKIVYYILKFIFINFGLIEGDLITTSLIIQLIIIILVTTLFSVIWIYNRSRNKESY